MISVFSLCPSDIIIGALSLTIFTTPATIVGEPPSPIFSVPNPISSIPNTVTFVLRALIAPTNDGLRGGIPVGVSEIVHGIGSFII